MLTYRIYFDGSNELGIPSMSMKGTELLPQTVILPNMNSYTLTSIKFQWYTLSGCIDKGIREFKFVERT